jgi:hypothetical protein
LQKQSWDTDPNFGKFSGNFIKKHPKMVKISLSEIYTLVSLIRLGNSRCNFNQKNTLSAITSDPTSQNPIFFGQSLPKNSLITNPSYDSNTQYYLNMNGNTTKSTKPTNQASLTNLQFPNLRAANPSPPKVAKGKAGNPPKPNSPTSEVSKIIQSVNGAQQPMRAHLVNHGPSTRGTGPHPVTSLSSEKKLTTAKKSLDCRTKGSFPNTTGVETFGTEIKNSGTATPGSSVSSIEQDSEEEDNHEGNRSLSETSSKTESPETISSPREIPSSEVSKLSMEASEKKGEPPQQEVSPVATTPRARQVKITNFTKPGGVITEIEIQSMISDAQREGFVNKPATQSPKQHLTSGSSKKSRTEMTPNNQPNPYDTSSTTTQLMLPPNSTDKSPQGIAVALEGKFSATETDQSTALQSLENDLAEMLKSSGYMYRPQSETFTVVGGEQFDTHRPENEREAERILAEVDPYTMNGGTFTHLYVSG